MCASQTHSKLPLLTTYLLSHLDMQTVDANIPYDLCMFVGFNEARWVNCTNQCLYWMVCCSSFLFLFFFLFFFFFCCWQLTSQWYKNKSPLDLHMCLFRCCCFFLLVVCLSVFNGHPIHHHVSLSYFSMPQVKE